MSSLASLPSRFDLPGRSKSLQASLTALRALTDSELAGRAQDLREQSATSRRQTGFSNECLLAAEAIRRSVGIELYAVQIDAAMASLRGEIVEMQTGEGKTFSVLTAAIAHALRGQQVHVATQNHYLAQRDLQLAMPVCEMLGLKLGLSIDVAAPQQAPLLYTSDIVYGTGASFGFDYLREQVRKAAATDGPLGASVLAQLQGLAHAASTGSSMPFDVAMIDEVDNVLLDDACSPLILSQATQGEAEDEDCHRLANLVARELRTGHDYALDGKRIALSASGMHKIHTAAVPIPLSQLRRTWAEYVGQALHALHLLHRDVHYLVREQRVELVDENTGRVFADRTWSEGLHQAVEAKERLPISPERAALAQITRQRLYRMYNRLSGLTGTTSGCKHEFRRTFGLKTTVIPPRLRSQRQDLPWRAFTSAESKYCALAKEVSEFQSRGQPVLVGTRSIAESQQLAAALDRIGLEYQVLNGVQPASEAEVVSHAGEAGAITIATNLAGRGTDIKLDDSARQAGGLHVVVASPNDTQRIDRQLLGRCGRQGDPGSTRVFVSAEDPLLQHQAPWLAQTMLKLSVPSGEIPVDVSSKIRRLQRSIAHKQAHARQELLRRDLSRESQLSRKIDNQ